MHRFEDLISRCTSFTLDAMGKVETNHDDELNKTVQTIHVKNLQMMQLQKAIFAIGIFSIFEAELQRVFSCENGFAKAKAVLEKHKESVLLERFNDFNLAINVLKHGQGHSYDKLKAKDHLLSFKVRLPTDNFSEGDVSEVATTLIYIDDKFVLDCAKLIKQVFEVIRTNYPQYF